MPPRKYQCDKRWTGTVFLRKGAGSSFKPKRSSSQTYNLRKRPMSGFLAAPDKYLVAPDLHFKASSGRGGGPETLRPFTSYLPLWQAHQTSRVSSRYCTVHARCVHVADIALYSPLVVRTSNPGRLPKRNIFPLFGFRSPVFAAITEPLPMSDSLGGIRNRSTG